MASLIDAQIERSGSKYQISYNLTPQNKIATEYEFSNVAVPPLRSSSKQNQDLYRALTYRCPDKIKNWG